MEEKKKLSEKMADFLYRIMPFKESPKRCKIIYELISLVLFLVSMSPVIIFALIAYVYYLNRELSPEDVFAIFIALGWFNNAFGLIGAFFCDVEELLKDKIDNSDWDIIDWYT